MADRDEIGRLFYAAFCRIAIGIATKTTPHPREGIDFQSWGEIAEDAREGFRQEAETVAAVVLGRLIHALDDLVAPFKAVDPDGFGDIGRTVVKFYRMVVCEAVAILYPDDARQDASSLANAKARLLATATAAATPTPTVTTSTVGEVTQP